MLSVAERGILARSTGTARLRYTLTTRPTASVLLGTDHTAERQDPSKTILGNCT